MKIVNPNNRSPIVIEFTYDEAKVLQRVMGRFSKASLQQHLGVAGDEHETTNELYQQLSNFYGY